MGTGQQQPQEQRAAGAGAVGAASLSAELFRSCICISEGIGLEELASTKYITKIFARSARVIYPNLEENRGESGKKAPSGHKAR